MASRRLSALVGLFRFIGELSLRGLVPEPVLHRCIKKLLASKSGPNLPMDMECLCTLLLITGRRFDTGPAVNLFDQYFARVAKIMSATAASGGLPLRVRFMLDDLLELRRNAWVPRRLGQQVDADRPRMMEEWRDGPTAAAANGGGRNGGSANGGGAPLLLAVSSSSASKERQSMQQQQQQQPPPPLMKDEPAAWRRPHQPALIAAAAAAASSAASNATYSSSVGANKNGNGSTSAAATTIVRGSNPSAAATASTFAPKLQALGRLQQVSSRPQQQQQQSGTAVASASQSHHRWQPVGPPPPPLAVQMHLQQQQQQQQFHKQQQQRRGDMPMLSKPKQTTFTFEPAYFRQMAARGQQQGKGQQPGSVKKEEPESPLVTAARDIESLGGRLWSGDHAWVREQLVKLAWPFDRPELLVHRLLVSGIEAEPVGVVRLLESLGSSSSSSTEKQQTKPICPPGSVLGGLRQYCDQSMASLESTGVTLVRSRSAKLVAQLVLLDQVSLSDCFAVLRGGRHHPLGLLLLQQLVANRSPDWTRARLSESGLQLSDLLPEGADLLAAVEERGLTSLVPKLKLLEDLRRGRVGTSPDAVAAFVAEADSELLCKPEFVHALVHHVYAAVETDPSSAEHTDKEKLQLEKARLGPYAQLLAELDGLELLNGLLVHWSRAGNPPNALLRAFMAVYDLDICDEETIVRWKEEVNHAYPDKGKALFQLNKFLNWLDQAEEESDEEADVTK
ncbi:hypothetical protein BOX15_Mlig023639g1 [Macrostomum lignano]|uniref:W2 domain-containing protein n=1 Tax=Macrostomum lignano TaxID=282301 RepID=A0A267G7V0_9PLAT|nr:hypothetical protein BOX15_Mlig023639g1 [Macrostomum lignano]